MEALPTLKDGRNASPGPACAAWGKDIRGWMLHGAQEPQDP